MPRPGRQTTERAKDFKGTLLQLLKTMGAYKISLIVVIVFAILSTIFNIAGPKILAKPPRPLPPAGLPDCAALAASTLATSAKFCSSCWPCTSARPHSASSRAG